MYRKTTCCIALRVVSHAEFAVVERVPEVVVVSNTCDAVAKTKLVAAVGSIIEADAKSQVARQSSPAALPVDRGAHLSSSAPLRLAQPLRFMRDGCEPRETPGTHSICISKARLRWYRSIEKRS